MKQPSRSRENSQRVTREDLASAAGLGRMAEIGALATATSAMAIGVLNAKKQPVTQEAQPQGFDGAEGSTAQQADEPATAGHADTGGTIPVAELVSLPDDTTTPGRSTSADNLLDPAALTARIAEQIASSVSHVLDVASGSQGTPQTLSHDIVEQAYALAQEVHGQFVAKEPLAILADLVPNNIARETLASEIIDNVDQTLADSGVMDLLHGVTAGVASDKIVDGIMADLHGLKGLTDVAAVVDVPLVDIKTIPDAVLGGLDLGKNPLADLFYDDGGADIASSSATAGVATVVDLGSELPKIGFVGQPIELVEELGGLTHGHNALNLL